MEPYPVHYCVDYPERTSRSRMLLRLFLGPIILFPHLFLGVCICVAEAFVVFISWWVILFTKRWDRSMFDFVVKSIRYCSWVGSYALWLCDKYPPYFDKVVPDADYPVHLEILYPEKISGWSAALRLVPYLILVILVPHILCLNVLLAVAAFCWFPVGFFAILFNGKWPPRLFDFITGVIRWFLRYLAYGLLLTDKYPPFSLE